MPELPHSIDVWICPECGRLRLPVDPGVCWCKAASTAMERRRYVLAEPTEAMIERATRALFEKPDSIELRGPRWIVDPMDDEWAEWAHRILAAALSTKEVGGG